MKLLPPLRQTARGTPRDVPSLLGLCTRRFGDSPQDYIQFDYKGHEGLDWSCAVGTPIYACHDGIAEQRHSVGGYGEHIVIKSSDTQTIYGHLSELIASGPVTAGTLVGRSGSSGNSTGPHLHLTLTPLTNGVVSEYNNGYKGAVDPSPYFVWPENNHKPMTTDEVTKLYVLAFYREPDAGEVAFWTGKSLSDFLSTAIKDRAAFLSKHG